MIKVYCAQDQCIEAAERYGFDVPRVFKINWLIRCERCGKTMSSFEYERLYKHAERQNKAHKEV